MPRLYMNHPLTEKALVSLNGEQSHYVYHVLRKRVGDTLTVFNEKDGDWLATITAFVKKKGALQIDAQERRALSTPPLWLAFAPLKQEATNFVLEKATELGVTHVQPLWMEHSNTQRLNQDRWQKIMIEAAEQCERHDVPTLLPSLKMMTFLDALPDSVQWFVALERLGQPSLLQALKTENSKTWGFIIGPEGGFSKSEHHILSQHSSLKVISLGPRVLRAETAALSVLAVAQSIARRGL